MINRFVRYQKGLTLQIMFPQKDSNFCACGCGRILNGRKKRWATESCQSNAVKNFFIIKGDIAIIRKELLKRDFGICNYCGCEDHNWEADHIIPVKFGGGACDLNNFQTLCQSCHLEKSNYYNLSHHKEISSQAEEMFCIRLLKDFGDCSIVFPKVSTEMQYFKSTFSPFCTI